MLQSHLYMNISILNQTSCLRINSEIGNYISVYMNKPSS